MGTPYAQLATGLGVGIEIGAAGGMRSLIPFPTRVPVEGRVVREHGR